MYTNTHTELKKGFVVVVVVIVLWGKECGGSMERKGCRGEKIGGREGFSVT